MTDTSTNRTMTMLHSVSGLEEAKTRATLAQPRADDSYFVGSEIAGQTIGLLPGGGPTTKPQR